MRGGTGGRTSLWLAQQENKRDGKQRYDHQQLEVIDVVSGFISRWTEVVYCASPAVAWPKMLGSPRETPVSTGDGRTHAGAQLHLGVGIGQLQATLTPVAGGVLGGQQRELGPRAGANRLDRGFERLTRTGVDHDFSLLAGLHIGELDFFEIGIDPGVAGLDQRKQRRTRADILALNEAAWLMMPAAGALTVVCPKS